jgi:hypothetical protein
MAECNNKRPSRPEVLEEVLRREFAVRPRVAALVAAYFDEYLSLLPEDEGSAGSDRLTELVRREYDGDLVQLWIRRALAELRAASRRRRR